MDKKNDMQLEIALQLAETGFKLFPSKGKRPLIKDWPNRATDDPNQIKDWKRQYPDAGFSVATGRRSNIVVLDIDVKNDQPGRESYKALVDQYGPFDTLKVQTPSRGGHLYFKYPSRKGKIRNLSKIEGYPGIELKADGGCVTIPETFSSKQQKNGKYTLRFNKDITRIADCPDWLVDLLQRRSKNNNRKNNSTRNVVKVGNRNRHLTSLAGAMRRQDAEIETILAALLEENEKRCNPPLPVEEVKRIAKSVSRYPSAQLHDLLVAPRLSDTGNAERLVNLYGQDLRYCQPWKSWLVWDGTRWKKDNRKTVLRLGKQVIKEMYRAGENIQDQHERSQFMKHVAKSDQVNKIRSMIELATADKRVAITPEDLDQNPYLLNLNNGTFDLINMEFRAHRREDNITKLIPIDYNVGATCPRWKQFLEQIMDDSQSMIDFLQRAIGYSLCGNTSEQVMFILFGTGANGKSTLIETIADLLGEYATQTPTETLLNRGNGSIPNDIARLKGARFVYAMEAEQNRYLAESRVKQLTGGDTISARYLYGEYFQFAPEFKLFLSTNHKPEIRGTDYAIWRRIRVIPFTVHIPEEKQDPTLKEKLAQELPGILNWALRGYTRWKEKRLSYPEPILNATKEYRSEMDILAEFLETRVQQNAQASTKASELFQVYKEWCSENNEKPMSQRTLGLRLAEHGFQKKRTGEGYFWLGLEVAVCVNHDEP